MSASRASRFTRCKLLYPGLPTLTALVAMFVLGTQAAQAQDRPNYIVGEPQGLEMLVHIVGEVQRPGEYRVRDRTNLLELFSKAGGPTEFSKMNSITIRRAPMFSVATDSLKGFGSPQPIEIVVVNLKDALVEPDGALPPTLRPGDVVFVPRNAWSTWRNVAAVLRDLSVVAGTYILYLRYLED
jgi:SLBB domain